MKWLKDNPFISGLVIVTLLVGGGLGFFLFQSWSDYSNASDSYVQAVDKLHALQNAGLYPSANNLAKLKEAFDEYKNKIDSLKAQLSKMEFPLDENITPQNFQDNLRAAVNGVKEKAASNDVKLPEKFYMGFEKYQSELPPVLAAPKLEREMRVIESFLLRLIDFKVQSIGDLKRAPLPQESGTSAAPAASPNQKNQPAKDVPSLARYPLAITFTADQGKFRLAFNSLLNSTQFIIVRSLELRNTSPDGPSRKESDSAASSVAANPFAAPATGPEAKPSVKILLGRELVKSTLYLEILDFVDRPTAKN